MVHWVFNPQYQGYGKKSSWEHTLRRKADLPFYAAPNGVKPTMKEKPWFNDIDYAEDLLKT
jgi:hypothetical protein